MANVPARVKTGIDELDRMLDGGLLPGSSILLQGAPGVGKTTFGLQFLYHGAARANEPGLCITFEEFPASLYRDAAALGWDLRALEEQGKLRIVFTSPAVFLAGLQATSSPITEMIQSIGAKRVVLDSVTLFRQVTEDPLRLRDIYNNLINGLKRERLTSLLISEDSIYKATLHRQGKLSFVVDGIILLRYVEVASAMQKALTILKMRGINHDRSIRRFEIKAGGIRIMEPFVGLEGILTGSSRASQT
jgi:circadian clock protein KaiC